MDVLVGHLHRRRGRERNLPGDQLEQQDAGAGQIHRHVVRRDVDVRVATPDALAVLPAHRAGAVDPVLAGSARRLAVGCRGVDVARVAGLIVAGEVVQVGLAEALFGVPEGGKGAGGQGKLYGDGAKRAGADRVAAFVQHLHVIAGHRNRRRAKLDRQSLDPQWVCRDGPAGFGLPPVVDHRDIQVLLRPLDRFWIGALARQIERLQVPQVVVLDEFAIGIVAADGTQRGRCGEEAFHLVLADHPPEGACIGRAHGLSFKDDGGASRDQRRVADVAVPHDPAHVRSRPEHVAHAHVIDGAHRPVQRNQMACGGADHALGRPGRARGIEDIGRVVARNRHTIRRVDPVLEGVPGKVTALDQLGDLLFALEDHAEIGLVVGKVDRAVQKRLVVDDPVRFDPA